MSVLLFSFYSPSVKVDNKSGQQVKDINFQKGKIKKAPVKTVASSSNGGAEGDRTPDLTAASRTLSQLSYSPTTEDGD